MKQQPFSQKKSAPEGGVSFYPYFFTSSSTEICQRTNPSLFSDTPLITATKPSQSPSLQGRRVLPQSLSSCMGKQQLAQQRCCR